MLENIDVVSFGAVTVTIILIIREFLSFLEKRKETRRSPEAPCHLLLSTELARIAETQRAIAEVLRSISESQRDTFQILRDIQQRR